MKMDSRGGMAAGAMGRAVRVAGAAVVWAGVLAGFGLVGAGLSGCGWMGGVGRAVRSVGGDGAELTSLQNGNSLSISATTRVYGFEDRHRADFYLTDLPEEVWKSGADASNLNGTMVHVAMFVTPKAGRTPIAVDANSAIVRVLVLSNGQVGLYGGGGFFTRSGAPGMESVGGSVTDGTVRLVRATPGFNDLLGPSTFNCGFTTVLDAEQAAQMDRAFNALSAVGVPIE